MEGRVDRTWGQVGCGASGNDENSEMTWSFLAWVTRWVTVPEIEMGKGGGGLGEETGKTFR